MNGAGDTHRPELLSQDRAIQTAAQLLVEGRTPEMFFREFVAWLKMDDRIQVRTFGGVSKATLKTYLEGFSAKAAFKQQVTRLAIIRDAEHRPASEAYESVRGVVQEVLKVEPGTIGVFGDDLLSIGIFILPDCSRSGMLESLCLEAWEGEQPADRCTREFGSCLGVGESFRTPKQRLAAHLVARNVVDPQLGRAAQQGVIPWDHSTFAPLTSFLRDLGATGQGGAS